MKVILKDDIEKLGTTGEVVEVKPGFGRNFLIPRNLAVEATPAQLKSIDLIRKQKDLRDQKKHRASLSEKEKLEAISVTASVQVGEEDKVFGSVTSQTVAELLAAAGHPIDRRKIHLEEPIKELGLFTVPVRLGHEVTAEIKLWVVKKE
jgi:large subunit ribosomal protein L9